MYHQFPIFIFISAVFKSIRNLKNHVTFLNDQDRKRKLTINPITYISITMMIEPKSTCSQCASALFEVWKMSWDAALFPSWVSLVSWLNELAEYVDEALLVHFSFAPTTTTGQFTSA